MNQLTLVDHKYQSLTLWLVYCLYLLVIPAFLGLIVNWVEVKKAEQIKQKNQLNYDATLKTLDSHHRWLMRTFIFCLVFALAAIGTSYYGVGYLVAIGTVAWWFYRVLKGMYMLSANKPMPT